MTNKERFKSLVSQHIKRDGIDTILEFLEKTDFYTAPASTRFHDSCEGGLCQHSLNVFDHLVKDYGTEKNMETLAIVSLLHDVCKVGFYSVSTRNTKDENGKWIQVPYYTVDDKLPLGHGEKSVIMLMAYMKLETEEMMAIRWHMLGFEPKENYNALSKAMSEFPLIIYLHHADLKASYLNNK